VIVTLHGSPGRLRAFSVGLVVQSDRYAAQRQCLTNGGPNSTGGSGHEYVSHTEDYRDRAQSASSETMHVDPFF
jgi:hypothetical protein